MEKWNLEQHYSTRFCVRLNDNKTETYEKLQWAYGEHALSRARVFSWHKAFLDGRESMEDETRSGRPCTSKTDEKVTKVRALMRSDRRLTEWWVLSWSPRATQKKGSSCSARDCGHLDAASRQCSLSHCHLREQIFDQKGYSIGSAPPTLAWFESVWLLPFLKT